MKLKIGKMKKKKDEFSNKMPDQQLEQNSWGRVSYAARHILNLKMLCREHDSNKSIS